MEPGTVGIMTATNSEVAPVKVTIETPKDQTVEPFVTSTPVQPSTPTVASGSPVEPKGKTPVESLADSQDDSVAPGTVVDKVPDSHGTSVVNAVNVPETPKTTAVTTKPAMSVGDSSGKGGQVEKVESLKGHVDVQPAPFKIDLLPANEGPFGLSEYSSGKRHHSHNGKSTQRIDVPPTVSTVSLAAPIDMEHSTQVESVASVLSADVSNSENLSPTIEQPPAIVTSGNVVTRGNVPSVVNDQLIQTPSSKYVSVTSPNVPIKVAGTAHSVKVGNHKTDRRVEEQHRAAVEAARITLQKFLQTSSERSRKAKKLRTMSLLESD
jgi:hypothetical protein